MKKGTVTRWKRPLAAVLGAVLVLGAVCGAGSVLPERVRDALPDSVREALAPITAQAAGGDKAIVMGTASVLGQTGDFNNDHANTQIVHYGGQRWYVIGYDGAGVAGSSGTMTLISVGNLKGDAQFRTDYNASDANHYSKSALKGEVDAIAGAFIAGEKAAVQTRTLEGGSENQGQSGYDGNKISGDTVNGALLWPLSVAEANVMNSNLRQVDLTNHKWQINFWWLRSPGSVGSRAARVGGDGTVLRGGDRVDTEYGLRPAFNLNLSSVLFTSAAVGGKVSGTAGADALTPVGTNSGNEWKLTLLDSTNYPYFTASINGSDSVEAGGKIKIDFSGAKNEVNEYVSAMIVSGSDILYYGNIASGTTAETGYEITIPAALPPGNYELHVFAEQHYNDNKTDYACQPKKLNITVTAPATVTPAITTGSLPGGTEGTAYDQPLAATGITGTPTWSITAGTLPAGLKLDASTGRINGTPTAIGTFSFTVQVTDGMNTAKKALSIKITATSPAPPTGGCANGHATCHWVTIREADEQNDGEMVYRCSSCGHEIYRVPISGYIVFNKNTMQKILDAPQGATISVSTRRWISFHRMVYQALADRPDVTLRISFLDGEYRGNRYSVTIPAGYDTLSLLNGTDYCGFLYLGSKFGLSPGE